MKTLKLMKHTLLAAALVGATLLTGCGKQPTDTVSSMMTALKDKNFEMVETLLTDNVKNDKRGSSPFKDFASGLIEGAITLSDIKLEKTGGDDKTASVRALVNGKPRFVFVMKNQDGKWMIDGIVECDF